MMNQVQVIIHKSRVINVDWSLSNSCENALKTQRQQAQQSRKNRIALPNIVGFRHVWSMYVYDMNE